MRRKPIAPRFDWRARVEALGLVWHSAGGQPYWDESACYCFTAAEIEEIEAATIKLYRLFLAAGDHVVERGLFSQFGIPEAAVPAIRAAWQAEPPALNFGRFDFGYDGNGPPKLFEFNCDTPTSLLEAAVIQWDWKEAVFPELDQYNSVHEALVSRWRELAPRLPAGHVHFAHIEDSAGEDSVTIAYLRDVAAAAGLATEAIAMRDIGWSAPAQCFVDGQNRVMSAIFKLYPWEWLLAEPFAPMLLDSLDRTVWLEPIWKMIWSNKAILPVLWRLFPDHPNLLAASDHPLRGDQVIKPTLSREGANIRIERGGYTEAESGGRYGDGAVIHQQLFSLPDLGGGYPVIGAWIVDGQPCGIGIREGGLITGNTARFVPHVIEG